MKDNDAKKSGEAKNGWFNVPPLQTFLGIELVEAKDGTSVTHLPWRAELCNRKGDAHGGTTAAMLDITVGLAIRSARPELLGVSTIGLTIHYLEPGRGDLTARGKVQKLGRTIAIAEGAVEDSNGLIIATATGSFRLIAAR